MTKLILILAALPGFAQSNLRAQRASVAKQKIAVTMQRAVVAPRISSAMPDTSCAPLAPEAVAPMISTAARSNAIAAKVVWEVARQESAFHPCAVSKKGAEGLMQLMPATQAMLGVRDPFDPQESLMAGARLLKDLLARYKGNLALALSAYNAGTSRVDRDAAIPRIAETQDYVAAILDRLQE